MPELSAVLLLASLSAAAAPQQAPARSPDVIVRAPELICRPVTRTGTRIGVSAVCRTREQWAQARPGQYSTIDDAQAKLEVIGADCGCE